MLRRKFVWIGLFLVAGGICAGRAAPEPAPSMETLLAREARRYPQPVRVGDLIGRDVLQPLESQPVLGRVAAVARRKDGGLDMIVLFGGVPFADKLGFGPRPIAVPVEAMALMGEYVAILDFTPTQLRAFPTADVAELPTLPAGDMIRVALTKPFH